jgi:hypothetical protein
MRTRKPVLTPYGLLSLSEKLSERPPRSFASAAGVIGTTMQTQAAETVFQQPAGQIDS